MAGWRGGRNLKEEAGSWKRQDKAALPPAPGGGAIVNPDGHSTARADSEQPTMQPSLSDWLFVCLRGRESATGGGQRRGRGHRAGGEHRGGRGGGRRTPQRQRPSGARLPQLNARRCAGRVRAHATAEDMRCHMHDFGLFVACR